MEGKLQTSFIPKKPVVESKNHNGPTTNIFSMVAWFIFIVIIAACVGVYFYEQYLNSAVISKNAALQNITNNFDSSTISHFTSLDAKLKAASQILNNHLAFSALLSLVANNTITSVQFTSLKYQYDDGASKTLLSLSGRAPNFTSVALQSDLFNSLAYFNNQDFSGVSLDQTGAVIFNFSGLVNPSAFSYQSTLPALQAPATSTPAATSTSN